MNQPNDTAEVARPTDMKRPLVYQPFVANGVRSTTRERVSGYVRTWADGHQRVCINQETCMCVPSHICAVSRECICAPLLVYEMR